LSLWGIAYERKARRDVDGRVFVRATGEPVVGNACADALEAEGYRRHPHRCRPRCRLVLAELKPDVAFNALHGPFGEDGTIQGILEYLEIPYTHSGVLASALSMDKEQAKRVAKSHGIPVAEAKVMNRFDFTSAHPMKPPYVVKPVREGSSFGVVIVKEDQSHPPQVITSASGAMARP
jgi:D-alanine-D-alanine ligase